MLFQNTVHVKIPFYVFFILSAYCENMGKVFRRYRESGKFWVVWSTQNRLKTHGKNPCKHKEAKIHKIEYISVNNGPTWTILYILSFNTRWIGLANISRYCPFQRAISFWSGTAKLLYSEKQMNLTKITINDEAGKGINSVIWDIS